MTGIERLADKDLVRLDHKVYERIVRYWEGTPDLLYLKVSSPSLYRAFVTVRTERQRRGV